MKIVRVLLVIVLPSIMAGCGFMSSMTKANVNSAWKLAKDNSSITYGIWNTNGVEGGLKKACEAIHNSDSRCLEQEKYAIGSAISGVGVFSAAAYTMVIVPKEFELNHKTCNYPAFAKDCTYIKVKSNQGQIGTLLEIVSSGNDQRCKWTGLNNAGGTVCPAYNWDYRKDMRSWDNTNGQLSVGK